MLVAVLSLALGIGANTTIFGVINALILRSLPVRNPQQLVSVGGLDPEHPEHGSGISLAMLNEIRRRARAFSDVFIWDGGGIANFEVNGARFPGSLDTVSGDYFAALGVRPTLGRLLTHEDAPLDGRPSAHLAVISYGCWQNRFAGDRNVIGKTIRVNDKPLMIIGVSPANFTGLLIDIEPEATVPIGFTGRELKYRENLLYSAFARLKPDVGFAQVRAQIQFLWPGILKATAPETFHGAQRSNFFALRADVQPAARGSSFLRERLEKPLAVLMALLGAVLLIACVNLANLLLARTAARRHEIAVRAALGAGRWRLARMTLTEALVLSSAGAALGLALAAFSARFLLAGFWTGYVQLSLNPSPDIRVVAFAALLAVFTGVLFGIVPAWGMSRSDLAMALSQGARTTGGRAARFSSALIVAQIALSLVLLMGAALFVRTLRKLQTVDVGYRRDHLLIAQLFEQPGHEKIANRAAYYHELVTRLSRLPGVDSVSYLHMGPANGYEYRQRVSTGAAGVVTDAIEERAGPGAIHTMGMHVIQGREFEWRDDEHAPRVAMVSESLARALFPNQNPIGRAIDYGVEAEGRGLKIVGVVNNARLWKPDSREPRAVYYAFLQEPRGNSPRAIIRARSDPLSIARAADRTIESLGHHYSLRTETLEHRADETLMPQRMIALLASGFSLLALVLAAIGLYGVISCAVTSRTAEIGVRMALGAMRGDVLRLVLAQVLRLIAMGIAIAIPAAFACTKLISGMLFGVSAADPFSIAIASSVLFVVALVAGFLPARRASLQDPMDALRYE
jgi:predicted permease